MSLINKVTFNGFYYYHSIDEHPEKNEFFLHCHNFYEIYYFKKGDGSLIIEGNKYELKKNSLLIIRPREFHYYKIEKPTEYERCTLHFHTNQLMNCISDELLLSPFLNRELGKNNLLATDIEDGIEDLFKRLEKCDLLCEEECNSKAQFILGELLCTILNISKRKEMSTNFITSNALAEGILHFINKNITEMISLEELSTNFFVSKYYLSHIFKKYTGVSILEYSLRKKVLLASEMIRNGEKANKAAENCGFGDYSSFYRAYKRILGVSPGNTK
jgi:AraC-like DNA-binding protein